MGTTVVLYKNNDCSQFRTQMNTTAITDMRGRLTSACIAVLLLLALVCACDALSGSIERKPGCRVNYSVHGRVSGWKWKWRAQCTDCTQISESATKSSRSGAIEHCLEQLMAKLARMGKL
ncbi:uncharacterized protein LOC106180694 [Lingula anatina]|uniref:Uncharacterized protein LOC106180694 n=1 Tax=Lingula anatina TaxID=7574 RepID=A0A1S3KC60_LINAN|nr:uncharacterized protein LOC106180694 [Lingula anatina]|eukprot:XP_013420223.1 uncharacterized protein LOC106180694 [Lingula anatina]